MYQGSNQKFSIEIKDHDGNTISQDSIEDIEILIYFEHTRDVKLKFSLTDTSYKEITPSDTDESYYFIIDSDDTIDLTPGRYVMNIKVLYTDSDFTADGGHINIEEAPIFDIQQSIKV